jgi:hypothetical protein
MISLNRPKSRQKMWATSVILRILPKANSHPLGENPPNLVTLVAEERRDTKKSRDGRGRRRRRFWSSVKKRRLRFLSLNEKLLVPSVSYLMQSATFVFRRKSPFCFRAF